MQDGGKWIIGMGVLITVVGIIWYFWGDKFTWIGHLPGDIRIEKDNFKFYFPITTMLLLTIIVNVVLRLIKYLGS